jgi:hypothetical protein
MKNVVLIFVVSFLSVVSFAEEKPKVELTRNQKDFIYECPLETGASDIYSFNVYRSKLDKKLYKEVELQGTVYKTSLVTAAEMKNNKFTLKFQDAKFGSRSVRLKLDNDGVWTLDARSRALNNFAVLGAHGCDKRED